MASSNKNPPKTPCTPNNLSQVLSDKNESEITISDFIQSGEIKLSQIQLDSLIDRLLNFKPKKNTKQPNVNSKQSRQLRGMRNEMTQNAGNCTSSQTSGNVQTPKQNPTPLTNPQYSAALQATQIAENELKKTNDLLINLTNEVKKMNENFGTWLNKLEEDVKILNSKFENYKNKWEDELEECYFELGSLKKKISDIESRNNYLENCISDMHPIDELVLSGINVNSQSEQLKQDTLDLILAATGLSHERLNSITIEKYSSSPNRLKLIVKDPVLRKEMLTTFRKKKPENLYLAEFLSKHNANLAAKLRNLKRSKKIFSVFTRDGFVYYKKYSSSSETLVKCISEIRDIQ